jgi:hypothetical protein
MNNSPILKYALGLVVLSGTCIPLASVAGVWEYDSPRAIEQPATEAAPPRAGLEGPIRTESMEPALSGDAGTIYELGQIQRSSGEAPSGVTNPADPAGRVATEFQEFPYP